MSQGFVTEVASWYNSSCRRSTIDAEVLMPSFHPRSGFATDVSTIAGRTTAIGSPVPCFTISDSARLLVNVYVFGQPNSFARCVPASIKYVFNQRIRFLRI